MHTEGGSFRSTTYHPVWVLAGRQLGDRPACTELSEHEDEGLALPGRWVNSHDLRPGDVLLAADGTQRYVVRTEQEFVSGLPVVNLTIEQHHTFAVGGDALLVHNTAPCPDSAKPKVVDPNAVEAPNSGKLRQNLADDGRPPLPDEDAHHIVAGGHQRAQPARERLAEEGIGINDAANGVGLPRSSSTPNPNGKAVHSRVHTKDSIDKVNDAVTGAAPGEVGDVLEDLRNQLESGGLQ